ncbi:MAG: hypothetical protein ABI432_19040 [Flavobacteriales bacterium]
MIRSLMRSPHFVIALLLSTSIHAQNADPVLARAGWDPLPDTLFLIWKLDSDQVRRLGIIEEDYDEERAKVMSDTALSTGARDAALHRFATDRRKEVKGVLRADQYKDWMARTHR